MPLIFGQLIIRITDRIKGKIELVKFRDVFLTIGNNIIILIFADQLFITSKIILHSNLRIQFYAKNTKHLLNTNI